MEARAGRGLAGRRRVSARLKFPIALKFAVFIALLAVASMGWLSHTATREAVERLEREINDSGIELVTALCLLVDGERLHSDPDHRTLLESRFRKIPNSPGMERVQDLVIYNAQESAILLRAGSGGGQKLTAGRLVRHPAAARTQVTIREHVADGIPVRIFTKSILGPPEPGTEPGGGRPVGRLAVLLSAEEIVETRAQLARALVQVALASCLAAALGSFVLGSFLTRPIRTLVKDLRQVSQGNLQHQSAIDSSDELGDLARTFNRMTASLQVGQNVKLAQRAMEQELSVATRIQSRLLPSGMPAIPGVDMAAHYEPAKEVGGDYYDFIPVDASRLGIVVADVSGKGVPGSLVMTMTRSLLRMAAGGDPAPGKVISRVNSCLSADMTPGTFVTLLYLVIHLESREIRLVRAGHNAPLLYSQRYSKVVPLKPRGIALGLDHGGSLFRSELEVKRFVLQPGDVLTLYTDGIVEGKNGEGKDYGEGRLVRLLLDHHQAPAREIVEKIIGDLRRHVGGASQSDDITIVVLKGEA